MLNSTDAEIEHLIEQDLLSTLPSTAASPEIAAIADTGIYIGRKISEYDYDDLDVKFQYIVDLSTTASKPSPRRHVFYKPLPDGKKGSKIFRTILPRLLDFITTSDNHLVFDKSNLLILCDTGQDFCVGLALAILSLFFDEDGKPYAERTETRIDKDVVRKRLTFLLLQKRVNPSRATLVSVNSVLMGWT